MENTNSGKLAAKVREQSKQRILRLNVSIVGRNRAENLTHALMTESGNSDDAVV